MELLKIVCQFAGAVWLFCIVCFLLGVGVAYVNPWRHQHCRECNHCGNLFTTWLDDWLCEDCRAEQDVLIRGQAWTDNPRAGDPEAFSRGLRRYLESANRRN